MGSLSKQRRKTIIVNMLLSLHIFLSLFLAQVCACETNLTCPLPTLVSSIDQHQLQLEMLKLFDVDKIPGENRNNKIKYSTTFMMELYKIVSQENDDTNRVRRSSDFLERLREDEISNAERSDVILSINCVNRKSDGFGQRQKLAFSMKNVPNLARLVGAELKLYQNKKMAKNMPYSMYKISVYKPIQLTTKYVKMKKVGEKLTSTDYTGWLSIDVSYAFRTWLEYRINTQDLYISVQPFSLQDQKEVHPASIGLIFQNEQQENEPFIVAFLQANNMINSRLPRSVRYESRRLDLMEILTSNNKKCGMHTLKVSFKELGWSEWVIAPDGYTTAVCQGTCDFPLKFPMETTNHAIIQSLIHLKNPKMFPKPSCAPTEISQLSVLFKRRESTILKNYRNMIVRACGCQ